MGTSPHSASHPFSQIGSRHICVLKFVCQRIQFGQIQVEKPVNLSDHLGWRSHRIEKREAK